ncbi:hypothetical protein H5J25_09580 [Sphingomonas aliaeris]|uniref:Uncharacterized protein n=1 Tax=Sphingomonas aliaeris TaxID=2759526 RepID=A0A974S2Q9_9SPHN|nr:hypothetical protein [Sphingomonas aliaeris]QQV75867.1 hypothetical protein H5J25_09580 [Sphingomonas aliaeris]
MSTSDLIASGVLVTGALALLLTLAGVIVAKTANAINRSSSAQQIAVAERELYLSLVEKRWTWMSGYVEAFMERQGEWQSEAFSKANNEPFDTKWERRLNALHLQAEWMFDGEIARRVNLIKMHQARAANDYWMWVFEGDETLFDINLPADARGIELAHEELAEMIDDMSRYLYVGDIERASASVAV